MSEKKESDTLRQRKFAQQEFLRLKKMQQGELDAGPKPSEVAAPLTFWDKLKNIWYHDKLIIFILALIISAIVFFCVQCATRTFYDATIVVYTHKITGEANCASMSDYFIQFCPDLNGDGEVNVNVINCSTNPDDKGEYSYTNREKALYLLSNDASALLFITDDSSYQYLMSRSDNITVFEGEPLELPSDFYEKCVDPSGFFDTPKDLQISCRTIKGSSIEKNKNVDTYYKQAQAILTELKNYKPE